MKVSRRFLLLENSLAQQRAGRLKTGTTHGFASRPNEGYDASKIAYEEVKADVGSFFGQHLVAS